MKDGDALFLRCTLWRQPAENVAETLTKGSRVIVTGRLKQRSYDTREGEKRTVVEVEVDVDEIGPSLRYATARVARAGKPPPPRPPPPAAVVNTAAPPAGTTSPSSDQPAPGPVVGAGARRVPPPVGYPGRPATGVPGGPLLGSRLPGGVRRVLPVGRWVSDPRPGAPVAGAG